jgi:uncharacterized protein YheU (UPF0270 family)
MHEPGAEGDDQPVDVPMELLGEDVLRALIESFVLREGTDYGVQERSLEEKVADVRAQLSRGEARIVFDPASDSVTILPA